MRAALYARVSTRDQQTLSMQTEAMCEYVARRGWDVVMKVEETSSGAGEREKRTQIIEAARKREVDVIIVWKLDRWGCSMADLVTNLQEMHALGVGFVSLTEALDFTTPSGKALAGMLAVFAEFERDMLRERIKAGIDHARAKGKAHGRPQTAMLKMERVKTLNEDGLNVSQIARELGISRTSVRRCLAHKS